MADLSQFSDDELKSAQEVTSAIDQANVENRAPDLSKFSDTQLQTAEELLLQLIVLPLLLQVLPRNHGVTT